MWLSNAKKLKAFSIPTALGKSKLPKKISEEELEQLVIILRADPSNEEVRNKIFESHLRLLLSITGRYAPQAERKLQDILSEGIMGIVYALENVYLMYDNNVTPWIVCNIHRFINTFIIKDHLIYLPADQYIKNPIEIETIKEGDKLIDSEIELVEVQDLIDNIINKETDILKQERKRAIVRLRAAGYTDEEVAEILNISRSYVAQLRNEVGNKFYEIYY